MLSSPTPLRTALPQTSQVACEHSSQLPHCNTCRRADAEARIQDVIEEMTKRAIDNAMLREVLTILEKMLDECRQAEAMCSNLNSNWVEHEYTYTERTDATTFTSRLQKLIGLALSFSPRTLYHDPHRAIKLIRLRHDAAITALDTLLAQ